MSTKNLIRSLVIVSFIVIVLTILAYVLNFSSLRISKNSGDWGTFGDFIGGILNPFFAFLNLLILAYLTLKITDDDNQRNLFSVYEAAKPIGEYNTLEEKNKIEISYHNCGFGPLKINRISIVSDDKEYPDFRQLFAEVKTIPGAHWQFGHVVGSEAIVAKDSHFLLLNFHFDKETPTVVNFMDKVRRTFENTSITIYYVDIYDRPMPPSFVNFGNV